MGKLDKYARINREKKTERIQTKLTPTEYRLYMKYLQERGLTQAEGTRYLILEELILEEIGLGVPDGVYLESAASIETAAIETKKEDRKGTKGAPKEPKKVSDEKPEYAQWRVDGKMPCPICRSWQKNIAAHLKGAHKTTKQKVFTDPEYIEIADQMAKDKTAKE